MDAIKMPKPFREPPDAGRDTTPEGNEAAPTEFLPYLREHGFPKLEDLQVTVFLGRHFSKEDAEDVLKHLKDADVFVQELQGWTEETARIFRAVSQGEVAPDETGLKVGFGADNFFKTMMAGMYNTKKAIAFADVPATNRELAVSREAQEKWQQLPYEIMAGKWSRIAAASFWSLE